MILLLASLAVCYLVPSVPVPSASGLADFDVVAAASAAAGYPY